jgi:hypothetical protein
MPNKEASLIKIFGISCPKQMTDVSLEDNFGLKDKLVEIAGFY